MKQTWCARTGAALVGAVSLSLAAACAPGAPAPERTADAIYTGGDIVTVNDAQPTVEAVAVKAGKILAVGTRAAVRQVP